MGCSFPSPVPVFVEVVLMYHIVEEGFLDRSSRLSDEEYVRVLNNVVVCCVDCAVVCSDEMLLGVRTDEPAKGSWWIMGGRMKPGEDPRQTARRVLQREIGLDVQTLDEIEDLNLSISYIWRTRSQPPQDHGCHMVGLYYCIRIGEDKRDALACATNTEFAARRWTPIREVAKNPSYHPGIQRVAEALM